MRHRAVAGILLVATAACAADDPTPAATPTEGPSADAPGSEPAEAEASPEASGTSGVAELEATGEPLPAGRYTRSGFAPTITLELDDGWEAVQQGTGFFDVQQRVGSPDVIAVQFAQVTGVFDGGGTVTVPRGHDDAEQILRENPALNVVEASESRIGGLVGSQVTVENAGELHASVLEVPPGALGIDPGRRLWIAFFDTDAGLLAIMVGGSVAEWQAALDAAEPVLESVRIGS